MQLYSRKPKSPELRPFVSQLWYWRDVSRPHVMERLMPNGESSLVVNLKDDIIRVYDKDSLALARTTRGAIVVGAHSQNSVIDAEEQECVFGIQFLAGGAYPFFGRTPTHESANEQVALEDLWGPRNSADLRIALLESPNPEAKFDTAESFLLRAKRREQNLHPAISYAVREIVHAPHIRTIADLTDATGLHARKFISLFRDQVGLTPKVFCRVRRFQRVIAAIHCRKQVDWARVALDCGYYDQSHFIHDFREFSGMSPSVYLTRATSHQNHVPVVD